MWNCKTGLKRGLGIIADTEALAGKLGMSERRTVL
jgi:hypothetical protein